MTEKEFQLLVSGVARAFGWFSYHTYDSRRSDPGFPDLVMVRGERVVFAELKAERGRVSPEQEAWLGKLTGVPTVETYLWRPDDFFIIEKILARGTGGGDARVLWSDWVER